MQAALTWDLFKHYLFSRRAGALVRTVAWLCIFGVGLGVTALIVVLSVMNGFNRSIKDRLLAVEPHLVVTVPGVNDYHKLEETLIYKDLSARPAIRARIMEGQEVVLRTVEGYFGGGLARGIDQASLRSILQDAKKAMNKNRSSQTRPEFEPVQTPLEEGGPESPADLNLGQGEILVGVDLARSLGVFAGDKLTVVAPEALLLPAGEIPKFERVTVKGLLTTNIADIDGKMIYYSRAVTFTHLADSVSKEVAIEVRLPDPDHYADLKKELEGKGAKVTTWIDRNSSLFFALKLEKIMMGTFLGLAALIASFSIVTVLVLLLMQKRKDIGVLMAMGLSPSRTRRAFIGLGLMLSSVGLGGGLTAGLLICWVLSTYQLDILPNIYYETTIPADVDPRLVFLIVVMAILISAFSAYFPARQHTRLSPAEALRPGGGGGFEEREA